MGRILGRATKEVAENPDLMVTYDASTKHIEKSLDKLFKKCQKITEK